MVQVWCVGVSEGVMVKVSLCRRCAAHVSVVCSDVPLHSPVPVSGHPSLPLPSACVRSPLPPTSQCLCQVTPPSTPQCLCQVTPPSHFPVLVSGHPSLHSPVPVSGHPSLHSPVPVSGHPSLHSPVPVSGHPSLHSPVPVSGHPSLHSPVPVSGHPSLHPQCLCQVTPPSSPCRFLDCKEDNADKFFTPAQRSMIVWDILQRVPYGEKEEQYGEGRGRGMYVRMWVGGRREVEL